MFENIIEGKTWKFGDNISTDLIMPGYAVLSNPDLSSSEAAKYCMLSNRPGWSDKVVTGDIIIAGKNFGCGSSRPASKLLKALGISVVIAESMSRIFFRNCINIGLPAIICPGILSTVEEGDLIEVDIYTGIIKNKNTGIELVGQSLPPNSPPMELLSAGGLIPMLKEKFKK